MDVLDSQHRLRVINSVAPIRICDNGGWTDTWFAGYGKVFNISVYPYVEVQIEVYPRDVSADRIVLFAENYGDRYVVHPEVPGWERHPLLEAAIEYMGVPDDVSLHIS
ncbi:MAG: GHMP kinase, partial [Anaerolineae bacterium]|nr:GHMP kinase [Anaerolineae bacterium]